MLSFEDAKRIRQSEMSLGQKLKQESEMVMQATWNNGIASRLCYIYDYFNDDNKDKITGYDPSLSKYKIPVNLRFITRNHKTLAADEPEYSIQFEPNVWNDIDDYIPAWFKEKYYPNHIQYPCGMYIDIPDDRGVYWKWLVVYSETANIFPKFGVLKCNYHFKWIEENGVDRIIRGMCGVQRSQASYTSGVWLGHTSQIFDNTAEFYLPWNSISAEIEHDKRFIISLPRKKPFVYIISKINETHNKGIIDFTLKQVEFNPQTDNAELLIADYYKSDVHKEDTTTDLPNEDTSYNYSLVLTSSSYDVGIGYKKTVYANLSENSFETMDSSRLKWRIVLNGQNVLDNKDVITKYELIDNALSFIFTDDDVYVDEIVTIECEYDFLKESKEFEITF